MATWKDIPGYPHYMASDEGEIMSKRNSLVLNKKINRCGYVKVGIFEDGVKGQRYVHRLVGLAFLGVPEDGNLQINHIDEDKTNNSASNLEWVTPKENMAHGTRYERWLSKKCKPVKNITTGECFQSAAEAQRRTGIYKSSIGLACKGINKTAGGYKWQYL